MLSLLAAGGADAWPSHCHGAGADHGCSTQVHQGLVVAAAAWLKLLVLLLLLLLLLLLILLALGYFSAQVRASPLQGELITKPLV